MTRRTEGLGSFLAAIAVLVLIAGTVAFGWAASITADRQNAASAPTTTDTSAYWAGQVEDAIDQLHSAQTALGTPHGTGQNLTQFLKDCQTAVAHYNATATAAGPNWPNYIQHPIDSRKECTP